MMKAINKFLKNKLLLSVVALCAALLIGAGAVFAWFLIGNPSIDDLDQSVVGSSNVTMDLIVDGAQGSLVFNEVLPGREYTCTVRLYNKLPEVSYVSMDFKYISSLIYKDSDRKVSDKTKSMLNVIGVKGIKHDADGNPLIDANGKLIPEDEFTCLAQRLAMDSTYVEGYDKDENGADLPIISNPKNANLRIFHNVPVPAGGDSETWKLEVTFSIQFLSDIFDASGALMDEDINDYQGQTFEIKQLRLEDLKKVTT